MNILLLALFYWNPVQGFTVRHYHQRHFVDITKHTISPSHVHQHTFALTRASNFDHETEFYSTERDHLHLRGMGVSGLEDDEIPIVFNAIREATEEWGVPLVFDHDFSSICHIIPKGLMIPGALGRVILLSLNNIPIHWDEEEKENRIMHLRSLLADQMDNLVGNHIEQPVLISISTDKDAKLIQDQDSKNQFLNVIHDAVDTYDLCRPIGRQTHSKNKSRKPIASMIKIDKGMVLDVYTREQSYDCSTILIIDDFIDDTLRERLLDVILHRDGTWNDKENGPDPRYWERGALNDIPGKLSETTCWGLKDEFIDDLCYNHHDAIEEAENKILELFPEFRVTRMPDAVYGNVSQLTANAPTHGDVFSPHIDADPNGTPASPWTDVFGRYYNRNAGKPRFVSCLLYLNDEWQDDWGATTKFFDPPTGETFDVTPKPGRCIIMDQDVQHSVVPPTAAAGKRPRYSLVWKLILHPKKDMQSMHLSFTDQPILYIGSAKIN